MQIKCETQWAWHREWWRDDGGDGGGGDVVNGAEDNGDGDGADDAGGDAGDAGDAGDDDGVLAVVMAMVMVIKLTTSMRINICQQAHPFPRKIIHQFQHFQTASTFYFIM